MALNVDSPYSLWRNGIRLGRLIHVQDLLKNGQAHGLGGILLPEVSLEDQQSVTQACLHDQLGMPIVHLFPTRFGHDGDASETALSPVSAFLDEEGRGIPAEEVFSVRTEDGTAVPTNLLFIHRVESQDGAEGEASLRALGVPEGTRLLFDVVLVYESAYRRAPWSEALRDLQEKSQAADDDNSAPARRA